MKVLKLSISIVALFLSSIICQAQPGGARPGNQERGPNNRSGGQPQKDNQGARVAKELGLTTKQAKQLIIIHEKQRSDNKIIKEKRPHLEMK